MTDRRPPKLTGLLRYVRNEDGVPQFYPPCDHPLVESVPVADLVAAVREGVESGAIEGEVVASQTLEDLEFGETIHHCPVEELGTYLVVRWPE